MDDDSRYEAVRGRDARFDGEFFFAVSTTGIYCRPSCPAITPKRENVTFYPTAAAAQAAGFRACRRCRPDAVPGSADWNVRADVVGRAMRLIGDGVVDREGVPGLAARLGYSTRQVQRQLNAELGAGPIALARAQRAHTARVLLQTTDMRAAEIAFAAGFASVRQFNDTLREIYAATPSELRALRHGRGGQGGRAGSVAGPRGTGGVPLRLAYRGPYASAEVFDYLQARAVAGVEEVVGEPGARTYRRTLRLPHGAGVAEVWERPGTGGWLECRLHLGDPRDLTTAAQRTRRLFDLDADPYAVAERLGGDPLLGPAVRRCPGLRVPGAPDPAELAFRAVLGQGAAVAEGRRRAEALVAAHGEPLPVPSGGLTHLFPSAEVLAEATGESTGEFGVPRERWGALRALGAALADGTVRLDPGADREEAERSLLAVPGVAPWTAGYVRMRALGDPDVLLAEPARWDGAADPARWRPWRSYATHHLWSGAADGLRSGRAAGARGALAAVG
ncbi:AlkA N-terminal domain-containing protein [Allostreptomyces psammosilenae]|uniref:DNA-3-methyladenine glycosylase II n=1 Tax=Allostreptomyces psammosilenae TaxID=1892865 RepID=A0A852ZPY1_9ACTN|nr:AlkA N-terminal domain-containing protein [Allostreptomyces psammosilenae]NYI04506.1 AraC family transcriptional regulator of adaptative response / DNA-3-methyladenine glycosylase II [Allostreptomyces psammosilenae]